MLLTILCNEGFSTLKIENNFKNDRTFSVSSISVFILEGFVVLCYSLLCKIFPCTLQLSNCTWNIETQTKAILGTIFHLTQNLLLAHSYTLMNVSFLVPSTFQRDARAVPSKLIHFEAQKFRRTVAKRILTEITY